MTTCASLQHTVTTRESYGGSRNHASYCGPLGSVLYKTPVVERSGGEGGGWRAARAVRVGVAAAAAAWRSSVARHASKSSSSSLDFTY